VPTIHRVSVREVVLQVPVAAGHPVKSLSEAGVSLEAPTPQASPIPTPNWNEPGVAAFGAKRTAIRLVNSALALLKEREGHPFALIPHPICRLDVLEDPLGQPC
jgi:hypothetical protein